MGADGGKLACSWSCISFLVLIGMAEATALVEGDVRSAGGDGERSVGDVPDDGKTNSSMFMGSDGGAPDWSTDSRNFAIPDGAVTVCWFNLHGGGSPSAVMSADRGRWGGSPSYRACSSPFFFRLIAINRQVIFSIRSWLAICVFTLLTIFHMCVPSGSFFCISSGWSQSAPVASSRKSGKKASRRSSRRVCV